MKSMGHIEMSSAVGDGHSTRDVLELARLGKVPVLKVSERAAVREIRQWLILDSATLVSCRCSPSAVRS